MLDMRTTRVSRNLLSAFAIITFYQHQQGQEWHQCEQQHAEQLCSRRGLTCNSFCSVALLHSNSDCAGKTATDAMLTYAARGNAMAVCMPPEASQHRMFQVCWWCALHSTDATRAFQHCTMVSRVCWKAAMSGALRLCFVSCTGLRHLAVPTQGRR